MLIQSKSTAQTGSVRAITPLTARNRELITITVETQLSRRKRVLKRLTADLQANDGKSSTAAGLTSIPFETEITTQLALQLDGLGHRKQPLQSVQANPLQTRCKQKFRTIPLSTPFQRHRASIRESDLKGTISPFLIETEAGGSRQRELKIGWLKTNLSWLGEPNSKVDAMKEITLGRRAWHPKLPLLISA